MPILVSVLFLITIGLILWLLGMVAKYLLILLLWIAKYPKDLYKAKFPDAYAWTTFQTSLWFDMYIGMFVSLCLFFIWLLFFCLDWLGKLILGVL